MVWGNSSVESLFDLRDRYGHIYKTLYGLNLAVLIIIFAGVFDHLNNHCIEKIYRVRSPGIDDDYTSDYSINWHLFIAPAIFHCFLCKNPIEAMPELCRIYLSLIITESAYFAFAFYYHYYIMQNVDYGEIADGKRPMAFGLLWKFILYNFLVWPLFPTSPDIRQFWQ